MIKVMCAVFLSDLNPVFEMRTDPDNIFKIWSDPDPGIFRGSDPGLFFFL